MPAPTDVPMPGALDITEGYTLRVTAIDPTTGALVSGVNITKVVITATPADGSGGGGSTDIGQWFLVPGINA